MIRTTFLGSLICDIKSKVSKYYPDVKSISNISSDNDLPYDRNYGCMETYSEDSFDLIDYFCELPYSVCSNVTTMFKSISANVYSNRCVQLMNSCKWDVYMTRFIYVLTIESIKFSVISVRILQMLSFIILPNRYSIQYNYDKFNYETSNECFDARKEFISELDYLFWLRSVECYNYMYLNMFANQMVYDRYYIKTNPSTLFKNIIQSEHNYKILNDFNQDFISEVYENHSELFNKWCSYSYYDYFDEITEYISSKKDYDGYMNNNMINEICCRILKYHEKILSVFKKNLSIDSEYAKKLLLYDFIQELKDNVIIYQI